MPKTLVIVESPAKARTIAGILGSGYTVVASYGHVRDLPESVSEIPEGIRAKPWARLGVDTEGDFDPVYVVPKDKQEHVRRLRGESKGIERLLLATDEDREGESISWHVLEVLKPKPGTQVERVVFHEVTPEAIQAAVANPRSLDLALVKAQEVRRILDRLYGYTLSPLLWRKVAPRLSAGRVQSVAVRLAVMRERERRAFVAAVYYDLEAEIPYKGGTVVAELHSLDGVQVASGSDFELGGTLKPALEGKRVWLRAEEAQAAMARLDGTEGWVCAAYEVKPTKQNPPPPFMTSSLQQEGVRKLGMKARDVMRVAQQLYEGIPLGGEPVGLITYMRTDSLTLSQRALREARETIEAQFGAEYLPAKPNVYASKAKNAQEAHEAIRPTDASRTPASVRKFLSPDQFKLYELVWKRTLACQMKPADLEQTRIEVDADDGGRTAKFVATGTRVVFPGFLRAYVEGSDDPSVELAGRDRILPKVEVGEKSGRAAVRSKEHRTTPPPRYTEASLVKKLEEEGVGRPSTYASIIETIQDRGYVVRRKNELVPSWSAFAVTELLEANFAQLVDIGFTARMEDELDEIAEGKRDAVQHLRRFYTGEGDEPGIERMVAERQRDIPYPVHEIGDGIVVRIGKNGPFLQRGEGGPGNTADVPEDLAPADLTVEVAKRLLDEKAAGPALLGNDPSTGRPVVLKTGRFGPYLEVEPEGDETPRRVSLPPGLGKEGLGDEEVALLLRFPRDLGQSGGQDVVVSLGRYGPYVTCGDRRASLPDWRAAADIGLAEALAALDAKATGRASRTPISELGEVEGVEGKLVVMSGRYGPYVTNGVVNATLPKGMDPASLTAEQAAELVKAKIAAGPSKRPARRGAVRRGRKSP